MSIELAQVPFEMVQTYVFAPPPKPVRPDVGELGAIAVASPGSLLLVVVVVTAGEEVAKDEFGDVDLLLLVDLHGNAITVVEDGDGVGLGVDGDLEGVHGGVTLLVVGGIDEDLVEDLVEAGDVGDGTLHHLVVLVHPQRLCVLLDGAYIGVGAEEDVLQLRLFLVHFLDGFFAATGGGNVGRAAAL